MFENLNAKAPQKALAFIEDGNARKFYFYLEFWFIFNLRNNKFPNFSSKFRKKNLFQKNSLPKSLNLIVFYFYKMMNQH